jgi:hypothetical protein
MNRARTVDNQTEVRHADFYVPVGYRHGMLECTGTGTGRDEFEKKLIPPFIDIGHTVQVQACLTFPIASVHPT